MTESLRFLRALQRIADTARRINPNPRPAPTIQATPNILTSLPEHKSLLPLLLSHDIPSKLARACADKYDGYANQLRSETESKLAPYLANRKKSQPAKAYSLFLDNYSKALRRWSQHILNAALKSLKRDSVELRNWEVTYPAPLWLPVCLSCIGILSDADGFVAATQPSVRTRKLGGKIFPSIPNALTDRSIETVLPFIHSQPLPRIPNSVSPSASSHYRSLSG